ncbi:MAG: transposase [Verrucomicrobia bacterium]|nr:transposase [Verrucomicrobiota bacterium]
MKGRKTRAIEGLEGYDFLQLANRGSSPRERRRFLAFAHIQDGKSMSEAARMVKVAPRTVIVWVDQFRKDGIEGLREKSGRGAKPYVEVKDYETLREAIETLQESRPGGRIRGKDVADLIEEKEGVRPSKSTVYRTMKLAGLVWITGRSIHPHADPEAQETFKKTSEESS